MTSRNARTNGARAGLALLALLVLTAGQVVAGTAHADANAEARVYLEQGNRQLAAAMQASGARRARLLEEALEAYVSSLRIVRSRNVLFNAGLAAEERGWLEDAWGYFTDYAADPDLAPEERAEALRRVEALEPRVALVAVDSWPPSAEVRVDRRDLAARGRTPIVLAVPAGPHTLHVTLPGHADAAVAVEAARGARTPVHATLAPMPVPVAVLAHPGARLTLDGGEIPNPAAVTVLPGAHRFASTARDGFRHEVELDVAPGAAPLTVDLRAAHGALVVECEVRALFSVDGRPIGEGTRATTEASAGTHHVRVEAPGRRPAERTVEVRAGEITRARARLARRSAGASRLGPWPLVTGIVAGVTAAGATALSVRALGLRQDFDGLAGNAPRARQEDAADAVDRANLAADATWGAAILFGVGSLVMSVANRDEPPSPSRLEVLTAAAAEPASAAVRVETSP